MEFAEPSLHARPAMGRRIRGLEFESSEFECSDVWKCECSEFGVWKFGGLEITSNTLDQRWVGGLFIIIVILIIIIIIIIIQIAPRIPPHRPSRRERRKRVMSLVGQLLSLLICLVAKVLTVLSC